MRDNYLKAGGFIVLGFGNHELLQESERVLLKIYHKLIELPDSPRYSKQKQDPSTRFAHSG